MTLKYKPVTTMCYSARLERPHGGGHGGITAQEIFLSLFILYEKASLNSSKIVNTNSSGLHLLPILVESPISMNL